MAERKPYKNGEVFYSPSGRMYQYTGPDGGSPDPDDPSTYKEISSEVSLEDSVGGAVDYSQELAMDFVRGANEGLLNLAGAPIDLINMLTGAVGLTDTDRPVGGSRWIKEQIPVGYQGERPRTQAGKVIGTISENVSASAVPLGLLSRTAQILRSAPGVFSGAPSLLKDMAAVGPSRAVSSEILPSAGSAVGIETARALAPGNQAVELVGSIVGGGAPDLTRASVKGLLQGENMAENVASARNVGVEPTVAEAGGKSSAQFFENLLGRTPGSKGRVADRMDDYSESIDKSIRQMIKDISAKSDFATAGTKIKSGIETFVQGFKDRSRDLYNQIPIPDTLRVPANNTRSVMEEILTPIGGAEKTSQGLLNPQTAATARNFLEDLLGGNYAIYASGRTIPYSALKELRTKIGERLSGTSLVDDIPRAELKRIYAALSEDIREAAARIGPDATRSFERANSFYRAGVTRIDDFLEPIVSGGQAVIPENIFARVKSGIDKGPTKIRVLRKSMPEEDWKVVQSSLIEDFARSTKANQQVGDTLSFDPDQFFRNYMGMTPAAREAAFGGKGNLKKSLDDLASVIERSRDARKRGANPSGTAGATADIAAATSLVGSFGYGAFTLDPTVFLSVVATMTGANMASRLMAKPKFVDWVANLQGISPQSVPGQIARLTNVLADEPDLLPAVEKIQYYLLESE